jgi:hypothetical protein
MRTPGPAPVTIALRPHGFPSTQAQLVSPPYAQVIAGESGLRAIWQKRDNLTQTSRVLVGDLTASSSGTELPSENAEKFLPGTGACALATGAYETTSPNAFRYSVWSLNGSAIGPIFRSSGDPQNVQSFPRIGEYMGVDCSSGFAWAAWIDLRSGRRQVYGALIPLR